MFLKYSSYLILQCTTNKMQSIDRCLFSLLPLRRDRCHTLRPRGHDYTLPNCTYNLHMTIMTYDNYIVITVHLRIYVSYTFLINTLTLTLNSLASDSGTKNPLKFAFRNGGPGL